MKISMPNLLLHVLILVAALLCFYALMMWRHLLMAHWKLVSSLGGILCIYLLVRILLLVDRTKRDCETNPHCAYTGQGAFSANQLGAEIEPALRKESHRRIISGDNPMNVIMWLNQNGMPVDEANDWTGYLLKERSIHVKGKGVTHILKAIFVFVFAALISIVSFYLHWLGYIDVQAGLNPLTGIIGVLCVVGLFLVVKGVWFVYTGSNAIREILAAGGN